ncbi:MAG: response regulator [Chloroflexi bacterium]|nr:response regulator [Chloroflexota bacterium]
MPSPRVVVVDDSERMRKAIKELLRAVCGCVIVGEGTNGLEGIELARVHRPDLVVMDINMPVMGGLDALRLLKKEQPSTPVAMVSSMVDADLLAHALDLGAVACLEKGPEMWDGLRAIALGFSQSCSVSPGNS